MMDPAAALANRVLHDQAWARQRLSAHAGQAFVVAVGPFTTAMRVDASGGVETASLAGAAPDLTLTLSPLDAPAFLANPSRWSELVAAAGDPGLASTLQDVAQALPWFAERVLSDALGPIVGQRVADAGRRLLGLPEHAAQRFGESIASYARDEAGIAAHATALARFAEETAALAARVDALAPRIDALAARLGASPGAAGGG
jgi:ubiquinone biosynthesis protein UbiJ